ncbi:hypothetical protein P280DRAFT_489605 [Massarina eburnea CBS 473.64]|uniref:Uncharacterized protein n=1 Tax=Massarina eburnea CBS 473.64 TaxID=1395130 RepID=A0A6A6S3D2_9PLEO|nr:hypothetical protein P280DRAFT_489605 [Massarina eburnea CBS 473.64]
MDTPAATLLGTAIFSWRWIISGTPLLLCSLFLAERNDHRVVPWLPLWAIFTSLNFAYVVASTSWLLYWIYTPTCYCTILLSSLYQFEFAARFARHQGRKLLRHVLFIQDRIGLFDLPALEIDSDTIGLFIVRGLTISLSTLTATAYGIEVGIKIDNDMELAIQTDKVVVKLFRRIEIGDVYANIKGSDEMCFGEINSWPNKRDMTKDQFVAVDTPILKASMDARKKASSSMQDQLDGLTESETGNKPVKKLSPDDEKAHTEYDWIINRILESTSSSIAKRWLKKIVKEREIEGVLETDRKLRAAISAHIHEDPTIAHPPRKSIRLTSLLENKHPKFKIFLHRLPLLYRMLLNPISYFHPIFIDSVTSTGSGKWFVSLMKKHFFKHYSSSDAEVRRLEGRISAWLADANFAVGLNNIYCTGHVPMDTDYDIECKFKIGDMVAHRTLPEAVGLTQVIHLGGADATFVIPSFLLPHHEHLIPGKLTDFEEMQMEQEVQEAEGTPQAVQLKKELERRRKDETAMKISVHGHLPFLFDQDLLNFVAATVKATKVIEVEKGHEELVLKRAATDKIELEVRRADSIASDSIASDTVSTESTGSAEESADSDKTDSAATTGSQASVARSSTFGARMGQTFKGMNSKVKEGWRKAGINTVNVVANDRWIAKIVGNIMRKLEKAQGDVGYSGLIALPLAEYREKAETESKILK